MAIDLHTHSTASDGADPAAALPAQAAAIGLKAIALTDHDTVAGLPPFLNAAADLPLRAIPGVELSCSWYGGSLHLLGLFIDPTYPPLTAMLDAIDRSRKQRNAVILSKLRHLDIHIDADELAREAACGTPGRLHIARLLVRHGYCGDDQEAFHRYIGPNGPAGARPFLPLPEAAIAAIHGAGGVAIWAHPVPPSGEWQWSRVRQQARTLCKSGLDAIETHLPNCGPFDTERLDQLAAELDLARAGGSDYHGAFRPHIPLGAGTAGGPIPDHLLPELEARRPPPKGPARHIGPPH